MPEGTDCIALFTQTCLADLNTKHDLGKGSN